MSKCLRCGREQEYIICKACAGDAGNFVNKNITNSLHLTYHIFNGILSLLYWKEE